MVTVAPLPTDALLSRYAEQPGCHTDCYTTEIAREIAFPTFVIAFYTTPLFRLERLILRLTLRRPSTDVDVTDLASGKAETFAAWTVEDRAANQLLLCDIAGHTRSWLLTTPGATKDTTRLWFGSAVVARSDGSGLGLPFTLLLGFHKLYSRALLASARRRLATI